MERTINAKQLRASLPETVERVRRGERLTVLYRSRPAFRIVPVDDDAEGRLPPLEEDPVYRAPALFRSGDGRPAADHDEILYGWKRGRLRAPRRSRRR
ncbi:MAG: type II toxin-antitoxin system prevent-host-death family antitoxin [Pseudomonadota bacterium]